MNAPCPSIEKFSSVSDLIASHVLTVDSNEEHPLKRDGDYVKPKFDVVETLGRLKEKETSQRNNILDLLAQNKNQPQTTQLQNLERTIAELKTEVAHIKTMTDHDHLLIVKLKEENRSLLDNLEISYMRNKSLEEEMRYDVEKHMTGTSTISNENLARRLWPKSPSQVKNVSIEEQLLKKAKKSTQAVEEAKLQLKNKELESERDQLQLHVRQLSNELDIMTWERDSLLYRLRMNRAALSGSSWNHSDF